MKKSVFCTIIFSIIVCASGFVYPVTYRICNKSGAPTKGQLSYYVLLPAVGCVGPSQFDLQHYESVDVAYNDRTADILYEDSLICCVMSIDVDGTSQAVNRSDACKDLTFVIEKKGGVLSAHYYRGLLDCKTPQ
jgi:hypothetical protein